MTAYVRDVDPFVVRPDLGREVAITQDTVEMGLLDANGMREEDL